MRITLVRFTSDTDSTVSRISVDGKFVCFGLEDEYRKVKVSSETRIPAGIYNITLRTAGKHHQSYKQYYPDFHIGMLWLQDVPGFQFILIHCGNTQADTSGCLLVGNSATTTPGNMSLSESRLAYAKLYKWVREAARDGTLSIEILDQD